MRKIALVSALAVLTVAGAGCGGGGSDTLTDREYTRALEKICSSADGDLKDIADPESNGDLADASDEAISIIDDTVADIKELKPPKDFEADHEDFIAALEDVSSGFEDLKAAANDDDDEAIVEAGDTLSKATDQVDEIADSIGADDCVGVGEESDSPETPTTDAPDEPTTDAPDEPTTDAPTTDAPDEPTTDAPEQTTPRITVPPVEMTMPADTQPPVAGTSIDTFDFDNLITPAGYTWQNIDATALAGVQDTFGSLYEGQIAAIGGANVTDPAGTPFAAFVFFWNETDIVASGTGINFLNSFTESAVSSSDTFTTGGYPVTIWTDDDGAEGVGVIDSDVSVILYGDPGTTQTMLDFFDAFIAAQG
jgi:hypothetical protein